jgi:hypothetical protein
MQQLMFQDYVDFLFCRLAIAPAILIHKMGEKLMNFHFLNVERASRLGAYCLRQARFAQSKTREGFD